MPNIYFTSSVTRLLSPVIRTHGTRKEVEKNSLKKRKRIKMYSQRNYWTLTIEFCYSKAEKRKFSANVK